MKKRKKRQSLMPRSLKNLRARFPFVQVVEKKVPYSFISIDLFGFADLIAINSNETYLIQTTAAAAFSARLHKILASPEARLWVHGESRHILLQAWGKQGARGLRKLWTLREQEITAADFQ